MVSRLFRGERQDPERSCSPSGSVFRQISAGAGPPEQARPEEQEPSVPTSPPGLASDVGPAACRDVHYWVCCSAEVGDRVWGDTTVAKSGHVCQLSRAVLCAFVSVR